MPRPKDSVGIGTLKERFRVLDPRLRTQGIAARPGQHAQAVIRRGAVAGRVDDKDFILVVERDRAFIDVQADAFPIVLRFSDQDAGAAESPGVAHGGDEQGLVRPDP